MKYVRGFNLKTLVPRYFTNCKWDDTQRNIIKSNNDLNIIYYFVQFLMVLSETFSSDQTYICRSLSEMIE